MNLKIDPEWLHKMADKEANGIVSVGGLVARVEATTEPPPVEAPEADGFTKWAESDGRIMPPPVDVGELQAEVKRLNNWVSRLSNQLWLLAALGVALTVHVVRLYVTGGK